MFLPGKEKPFFQAAGLTNLTAILGMGEKVF